MPAWSLYVAAAAPVSPAAFYITVSRGSAPVAVECAYPAGSFTCVVPITQDDVDFATRGWRFVLRVFDAAPGVVTVRIGSAAAQVFIDTFVIQVHHVRLT